MAASLQVIYPISEGTHFDYDYYTQTHMALVDKHMGPHLASTLVTKGMAGGPDTPPKTFAVASFTFADDAALQAALKASPPLLEDIPNFTNVLPEVLIGEVIA